MDFLEGTNVKKMEEYCVSAFPEMLFSVKDPLKTFKKNEYEKNFLTYYEQHKDLLEVIDSIYEISSEAGSIYANMTIGLIQRVEESLQGLSSRKREACLMDHNMTVVIYLLPAVLRYEKSSGDVFCQEFLHYWKEHLKKASLKAVTYEEVNAGFQKRYCYITTAVCKSLAKEENCTELMVLRKFRDTYLMQQENGEELIRSYYNIAPSIVKCIDRLPNHDEIYYNIYREYLAPCITLITEQKNKQCMELYTRMVHELQQKYFLKENCNE